MKSNINIQKQLQTNNDVFPWSFYRCMKIWPQSNSTPTIGAATWSTTFEIPGGNV